MPKKAQRFVQQRPHPITTSELHHETMKKKPRSRYVQRKCGRPAASLFTGWKKLTTEQKILAVVMGLIGLGMTAVLAYQLIPVISEGIRNNPSEPPEFLNLAQFNSSQSALSQKSSLPVCPVRPAEQPANEMPSIASVPPVVKQPKTEKKNTPSTVVDSSLLSRENIDKAIQHTRIHIKPSLRQETAAKPSGSEWISLMEEEITMIKKLLPETVHPELLLKVLNDPTFSIELVAYNDPHLTGGGESNGAMARYLPLSNKLLIGSDTDMTEKEKLSVLRNEMHHVAVRYTNYLKQSSPQKNLPTPRESIKVLRPMIKDGWKKDHKLAEEHREALTGGFNRITHFKNLLNQSKRFQHGSLTDKTAKNKLNEYLTAVKNYQPMTHVEVWPVSIYRELKKAFKEENGKWVIPIKELPRYLVGVRINRDEAIVRYNFLKSEDIKDKAKAFIHDAEAFKESMGPKGGYSHYSAAEDLGLELSSFIQEIDPGILKSFFPEWCNYFSRYHQVNDYCKATS